MLIAEIFNTARQRAINAKLNAAFTAPVSPQGATQYFAWRAIPTLFPYSRRGGDRGLRRIEYRFDITGFFFIDFEALSDMTPAMKH